MNPILVEYKLESSSEDYYEGLWVDTVIIEKLSYAVIVTRHGTVLTPSLCWIRVIDKDIVTKTNSKKYKFELVKGSYTLEKGKFPPPPKPPTTRIIKEGSEKPNKR